MTVIIPQHAINHIIILLDASSSMISLKDAVVKVADSQVRTLAQQSRPEEHDQETRISVYSFSSPEYHGERAKCLIWDKDVLRIPSIAGLYEPYGNTALCDAVIAVIDEMQEIPVRHGDHSFLLLLVSDGKDNTSLPVSRQKLPGIIRTLSARWTVAAFAPGPVEKQLLAGLGFPRDNVQVWNPSEEGLEEVGAAAAAATGSYMAARSSGMTSTQSLFSMTAPSVADITASLTPLTQGSFWLEEVSADTYPQGVRIDDFIETVTKNPYTPGKVFYQMMKRERIQPRKQLAVQAHEDHQVYMGPQAKRMLGVPDNAEVRISPGAFRDYSVFVQSMSFNRKLLGGTRVLVLR